MGKGGEQQQAQAALPRGVVTHSYGTDAADTVSSKGASSAAASRSFQVRAGETVELLDIEDETWWKVRICGAEEVAEERAEPPAFAAGDRVETTDGAAAVVVSSEFVAAREATMVKVELEGGRCRTFFDIDLRRADAPLPAPRSGWMPEEHVRVLAHRPSGARMVAGSADWRTRRAEEDRSDEDREVAKLLAYEQILEWRRANGKPRTQLFLCEDIFDSPLSHLAAALLLGAHAGWVWRLSPSPWQLVVGAVLGFIAVDLLSTVYHLCLDYAVLSTADTTVTDLHHKLTLNYNLFPPRKLLATSYIAVVPLHALHMALHLLLALLGVAASPTFTVYTLCSAVLGCSCGFVHNAAHRRRHGLEIARVVWLLQDLGVLLHPDIHAAHHQGKHDCSFSLFSGVTHPFSDRVLRLAWDRGWLPRTPETFRAKLD